MIEEHPNKTESHKIEQYEAEIELIDLLRVIWRWKFLIIAVTIICGLIAAIIGLNKVKIYSIEMVIKPGILSVKENGGSVFIDSSQNIKSLIDSETFNKDIINYLDKKKIGKLPKKISFKVIVAKQSNTIKLQYSTDDIKQGKIILDRLRDSLIEMYKNSSLFKHYKNEYDIKIELKNRNILEIVNNISEKRISILSIKADNKNKINQLENKLAVLIAEKKARANQIKNLNQRIFYIEAEIGKISKNTDLLIEERNKLLSSNINENNILSSVIYSNTIQQNISYLNSLRTTISDVNHQIYQELMLTETAKNNANNLEHEKDNLTKQTKYEVEKIESEIMKLEGEKSYVLEEIKNLKFKKDNIQSIQFLTSPTSSLYPINSRAMLTVSIASIGGFFFMLVFTFFLEYLRKHKNINPRASYR